MNFFFPQQRIMKLFFLQIKVSLVFSFYLKFAVDSNPEASRDGWRSLKLRRRLSWNKNFLILGRQNILCINWKQYGVVYKGKEHLIYYSFAVELLRINFCICAIYAFTRLFSESWNVNSRLRTLLCCLLISNSHEYFKALLRASANLC